MFSSNWTKNEKVERSPWEMVCMASSPAVLVSGSWQDTVVFSHPIKLNKPVTVLLHWLQQPLVAESKWKEPGELWKVPFAVSGKTYAGFSGTDFHGFQIVTFFILKGQFSPPFFLYLCVPLSLTIEVLTQRMVLNFKFWNEDVIEVWKTGQVDSDLLFVYVKIA